MSLFEKIDLPSGALPAPLTRFELAALFASELSDADAGGLLAKARARRRLALRGRSPTPHRRPAATI